MTTQQSGASLDVRVEEMRQEAVKRMQVGAARNYVPTSAWLSFDRLGFRGDGHEAPIPIEGLSFFVQSDHDRRWDFGLKPTAVSSTFLAIVTGRFGVGKTELARQICKDDQLRPFPVMLSRVKDTRCLRDGPPTVVEMMNLLFAQFNAGRPLPEDVRAELLRDIQRGNVLLILDGLDELIFDADQHDNFVSGLADLLFATDVWYVDFRVIVTVRREYLTAFDGQSELASRFRAGRAEQRPFAVPFLRLDYLRKSELSAYLEDRLLFGAKGVERHPRLLEILDRPLLARIFCDYADEQFKRASTDGEEILRFDDLLDEFSDGVDVIDHYIGSVLSQASNDSILADAQREISPNIRWDLTALAGKALQMYRPPNKRDVMTVDDVRDFAVGDTADSADDETVMLSAVHKCPFLQREHSKLHYAHITFYEFLVAKGLFLDADNLNDEGYGLFDELVFDPDIRRFVKAMMGHDVWYRRNIRTYALLEEQLDEWDPKFHLTKLNTKTRKELLIESRLLLDVMTDPDGFNYRDSMRDLSGERMRQNAGQSDPDEALKVVEAFVDRKWRQLHPRYVRFNLEATKVYIKAYHWDPRVREIRVRFSNQMEEFMMYLDDLLPLKKTKSPMGPALQGAYELLVTQMLEIARRLRYPWAKKYKDKWTDQGRFAEDIGETRPELAGERLEIFNDSFFDDQK